MNLDLDNMDEQYEKIYEKFQNEETISGIDLDKMDHVISSKDSIKYINNHIKKDGLVLSKTRDETTGMSYLLLRHIVQTHDDCWTSLEVPGGATKWSTTEKENLHNIASRILSDDRREVWIDSKDGEKRETYKRLLEHKWLNFSKNSSTLSLGPRFLGQMKPWIQWKTQKNYHCVVCSLCMVRGYFCDNCNQGYHLMCLKKKSKTDPQCQTCQSRMKNNLGLTEHNEGLHSDKKRRLDDEDYDAHYGSDDYVRKEKMEAADYECYLQVPNEVFTKIMMKLDGGSLHTARQVSKEWNSLIETQVLGTVEGRGQMERTLQLQWREAAPSRSEVTIGGFIYPEVATLTDKIAVIISRLPWSVKSKVSLVDMREGVEVPGFSCLVGLVSCALLTKDVLLVAKLVAGEQEFLAQNINTNQEIFKKKFPAGRVVFDQHNKQVMLGRNTRLVITGTTVTEINQASLPGDSFLVAFSHPHYLTLRQGWDILWNLDGPQLTRVRDVGDLDMLPVPVFCPAKEILVQCSPLNPDRMRFRAFSTQTGELTKIRGLTLPTGISSISRLAVNAKQLVVVARQQDGQHALLVFDLDCLLSQSADQDIAPRVFEIGQPGFLLVQIYLDKTKVTAGLLRGDTAKFITLDFWNCQN